MKHESVARAQGRSSADALQALARVHLARREPEAARKAAQQAVAAAQQLSETSLEKEALQPGPLRAPYRGAAEAPGERRAPEQQWQGDGDGQEGRQGLDEEVLTPVDVHVI